MKRFFLKRGWPTAIIIFAALLVCPWRSTLIRLAIVAFGAAVWIGLVLLTWKSGGLRILMCFVTASAVTFLCLPGRSEINQGTLRQIYLDELRKYDGVRYVYGGENRLGVDCSGLVRAAMFKALRTYGIKHCDARVFRSSIRLWWRDSNAIDLGKGRTGDTSPIGSGEFSALGNHDHIASGDLAVTESGSHVLAYVGGEMWIEAEPAVGGTHIFSLTGQFAPLAGERVRFVRWRWLASNNAG